MEMGHKFPKEHGFKGSAHKAKNFKPTIPGYDHGSEVEHGSHMEHAKGAKEHYGKKGHIDHDGESHMSHVHYDEHGFQHHKKGGMAKKMEECGDNEDIG